MPDLFAEKLRHTRQQSAMTQAELAHQLNLSSHAHIANLEAGRDVPSLDLIVRAALLLGVTIDYFLRDTIAVAEASRFLYAPSTLAQAPQSFGFG